MNPTEEFKSLLLDLVKETGVELRGGAELIAEYAATRAAHLATLVGSPAFNDALKIERDALALYAGLRAVDQAKVADAKIEGAIYGALRILAGVIAVV